MDPDAWDAGIIGRGTRATRALAASHPLHEVARRKVGKVGDDILQICRELIRAGATLDTGDRSDRGERDGGFRGVTRPPGLATGRRFIQTPPSIFFYGESLMTYTTRRLNASTAYGYPGRLLARLHAVHSVF